MTWTDTPTRYGAISRALHWAMAALFAWQFAGMLLKFVLGRVPLMKFWVGTHSSIGTLLLILLALRLLWALAQRLHRQHPARHPQRTGSSHIRTPGCM